MGDAGASPPWDAGVADPQNTLLSRISVPNFVSVWVEHRLGINRGSHKIESVGAPPPWDVGMGIMGMVDP